MSVLDDIKTGKGWIVGIITFTTATAGLCTTVFGWEVGKVTAVALVAVCVVLGLGIVIQRAESRNTKRLEMHIKEASKQTEEVNRSLDDIKWMLQQSRQSTLRIEMNNTIARNPENHDTILKMAEKYFLPLDKGGLGANWVMLDSFGAWMDSENDKGRKVYLPLGLGEVIYNAKQRKQ